MERKYEVSSEHFHEKILAAVFYGFRAVENPETIVVHPELMMKIRDKFRNKVLAPKNIGDVEVFCGLMVIEDASKEKDYLSVR
jgi:hypothetical protein